jgi:hypothetical protein
LVIARALSAATEDAGKVLEAAGGAVAGIASTGRLDAGLTELMAAGASAARAVPGATRRTGRTGFSCHPADIGAADTATAFESIAAITVCIAEEILALATPAAAATGPAIAALVITTARPALWMATLRISKAGCIAAERCPAGLAALVGAFAV